MNERWNLDSLYRGFDDPQFTQDLQSLTQACTRFASLTGSLEDMAPAAALRQGIDLLEEINTLGNSLVEFASLRQSADTGDSEAASALGQVLAVFSQTAGPNARFQAYAAALP